MDPDPGSRGTEADSQPQAPATAEHSSQVMLAEYAALRAEIDRRSNVQWNVFALQITATGVIASLAISHLSDIALLLVIPLSSYMLGSRYILHDYYIRLINRYIRDSLSKRLYGHLNWECWKMRETAAHVQSGRWMTPTGWNLLHPTRLAFEGVAWLALLTAALAAAYSWWNKTPQWGLIFGFVVLWILGLLATYFLHRSFDRSHDAAYTADMDTAATPEQTAKVQRLFDEIGLDVRVSATYTAKSVEIAVAAVLFLVGAGMPRAWLNAAASFGKALGDDLGRYSGERIKAWLEQLRQARGREVVTIVRDSFIGTEIRLTGDEPSEALEQLKELIENDQIKEIPGKAAEVRYREGDGWVRPF